ncbi:MAG: hypothetical protein AABN95_26085 [Acidobacteriota bacterium]
MTLEELNAKVRDWDLQYTGDPDARSKYGFILDQLNYHAAREWKLYLPAEHPDFNQSYMERLASWIGNVTDEDDQKLLLEYALSISFFSHDDFAALYQSAMNREVTRWVAEQIGAHLNNGGTAYDQLVQYHIHHETWFCPVTDSMDINEFYKVNHLKGIGHRPAFATLVMLAEETGIPNPELASSVLRYMDNPSLSAATTARALTRLVLLEDVVGSGTQCIEAVRWAVANIPKPILFVPLILCPNGVEALHQEVQQSTGQLTVRPVIELQRSDLLGPERQGHQGWPIAAAVEDFANRYASRASLGMDTFGFQNTGCSMATFANTPDNTLPIVHNKPANGDWEPIFPRVYRD